ncbi:MAG TPA: hypothetical protein VK203_23970 [Nostocaceae cyanobacterium]|nr:hypothetical protein [Nostocaceae cyanobacterium]
MANNYATQTWGYFLTGQVSENLIHRLEGQEALNNYSESWQLHERAKDLIFTLVGVESCLFYVRRFNIDQHNNQREIWTLTLASDKNYFDFANRLNQFDKLSLSDKQKTLQLWVTVYQNNSGCLGIYRIILVDAEEGRKDAFSVPFHIKLVPDTDRNIGIPKEAFDRITSQPFCKDYVPTENQIRRWGDFLRVEKKLIEKKQFCVRFISHNFTNEKRFINFTIDKNFAFGIHSNLLSNMLKKEGLIERILSAIGEDIQLVTEINSAMISRGIYIGKIEKIINKNENIYLTIEIDEELIGNSRIENINLPKEAYLLYKDVGSIVQLQWKERALTELKEVFHTHNIKLIWVNFSLMLLKQDQYKKKYY